MSLVGFQKFCKHSREAAAPIVSIAPTSGRIALSTAAAERFSIRAGAYALLLFNPTTQQIAIKISQNNTDKDELRLQARHDSGPYLRCPKFLTQFNIQLSKASFFILEQSDDDPSVFLIDLNKPATKGGKAM